MYNSSYQPSFGGQQVQSQYRGFQKTFQPTGFVQSYYQPQKSFQSGSPSPQSYHLANYAGNQQDHDAKLREDSRRPSSYTSGSSQGMGTMNFSQPSYQANVSSRSYHMAHYKGNQQDHDAQLREDSQSPSSFRGQSMMSNQYHLSNYVGNQQDHDAQLREDSMRPSSYATGQSQGMGTLSQVRSGFRSQ